MLDHDCSVEIDEMPPLKADDAGEVVGLTDDLADEFRVLLEGLETWTMLTESTKEQIHERLIEAIEAVIRSEGGKSND
jgi:hypothetical protein